jgi:hypothetical protein
MVVGRMALNTETISTETGEDGTWPAIEYLES